MMFLCVLRTRHLESKRFHVVANMAMEPTWITGGFTDMHVHLKEEKDDDGAAAFGRRSRARALSYVPACKLSCCHSAWEWWPPHWRCNKATRPTG